MRHGIEQSGFETFALFQGLSLTRPFEGVLQFVIEPFALALSVLGFLGAPFCPGGKLPDGECSYEKGHERNPVVRSTDGKSAEWRKKKEVEANHTEQRSKYCRT